MIENALDTDLGILETTDGCLVKKQSRGAQRDDRGVLDMTDDCSVEEFRVLVLTDDCSVEK